MNHNMVIVTGEPRSGTSLTMGLLDRMGVPIHCDADKRRLSYETDGTGIPDRVPWLFVRLAHAERAAIKLLCLPATRRLAEYRPGIVFCMRDPSEQVTSQIKFMRAMMPGMSMSFDADRMEALIARHNATAREEFERATGRKCFVLRFEDLIENPEHTCRALAVFVGVEPKEAWRYVRARSSACAPDMSIELDAVAREATP